MSNQISEENGFVVMIRVAEFNVVIRRVAQPVSQYNELKFSITSSDVMLQKLLDNGTVTDLRCSCLLSVNALRQ